MEHLASVVWRFTFFGLCKPKNARKSLKATESKSQVPFSKKPAISNLWKSQKSCKRLVNVLGQGRKTTFAIYVGLQMFTTQIHIFLSKKNMPLRPSQHALHATISDYHLWLPPTKPQPNICETWEAYVRHLGEREVRRGWLRWRRQGWVGHDWRGSKRSAWRGLANRNVNCGYVIDGTFWNWWNVLQKSSELTLRPFTLYKGQLLSTQSPTCCILLE